MRIMFPSLTTYVRVISSREHSPRANPGLWMHDDSRGPGIWELIVSLLNNNKKTRFVTSCCHFWRRSESRVSNSQALSFWSRWRAFIDNKTTFFVFFQLEWLISWPILCSSIELKQLCLLWMATNNFVYRSAGLRGRAFDRHSRNRGGICQQKLPGGPDMWPVFSIARGMPGVFPGGRVFAAGTDSHITYQHSLQHTGLLSPSYRRQLLTGRLLNKIFGTVKTNEQKK